MTSNFKKRRYYLHYKTKKLSYGILKLDKHKHTISYPHDYIFSKRISKYTDELLKLGYGFQSRIVMLTVIIIAFNAN